MINTVRIASNKIEKIKFDAQWRRQNMHNETTVIGTFPIEKVTVGKGTYGSLHVRSWGQPEEKLTIGNFCSIGDRTSFLLGGNHRMDTFMSFPIHVKIMKTKEEEAYTKGPITIMDDVWIGADAVILSGVTIGKGAVIGVGAVIAKDVEPYSIMVGNPAKLIRKRFSEDIIQQLLEEDFSLFSFKKLNEETMAQIYTPLTTIEDVKRIADLLR